MYRHLIFSALFLVTLAVEEEVMRSFPNVLLMPFNALQVALDSPRILASKFPQSMYAVEKMDLVIEYSIFNTGDKTAYKVS